MILSLVTLVLERLSETDIDRATFGFQLAAKVSSLQDELGNMRLEETLGAALVKNLEDPHGSANARLLAHLDQVPLQFKIREPAD